MTRRFLEREALGDWAASAACVGRGDVMYGPEGEQPTQRMVRESHARQVCAGCAVMVECREHAFRTREYHGVWGGLTEAERRTIARRRYPGHYSSLAARLDEIEARIVAGETRYEIADSYGVSLSTLSRALNGQNGRR